MSVWNNCSSPCVSVTLGSPSPTPESSLNAAARIIHLKPRVATESDPAPSSVQDLALALAFSTEKSKVLWWLAWSHNIPSLAPSRPFYPLPLLSASASVASWLLLSQARHVLPQGFALADPSGWMFPADIYMASSLSKFSSNIPSSVRPTLTHLPTLVLFKFYLAAPRGMWDLSSPTRDQTRVPCIGSTES